MAKDLLVIFQTYVISGLLQILAWPWLYKYGTRLIDNGWAAGRVLISLTVGLVIWFLAHLNLPINTFQGVGGTIIGLAVLTLFFPGREIRAAWRDLKKKTGYILTEEVLFLLGFVIYALVRGYNGDILGLEKFMDWGFIKSYLSSPVLPTADMWWAGSSINYYSFGHFWTSILIRLWGVDEGRGFNLMLAFVLASSLAISFGIIANLIGKGKMDSKVFLAGIMGALLVTLGGNSHTLWYLLTKGGLTGYWYADATRFIPFPSANTIHEFPGYSFVVSDLHGHVLGLPVVLTFLLGLVAWAKEGAKKMLSVVLGVLVGIMAMTNTWDSAIYGLLLVCYGLVAIIYDLKKLPELIRSAMLISGAAVVTALVWWLGFKPIDHGIGIVTARSPIWQLGVLWAGHVSLTLIAMGLAIRKQEKHLPILALGICAISLLVIPEFVFVRDIYPNHPRANTMFKLTYQAIIMMSLLAGWGIYRISQVPAKMGRALGLVFYLTIFGGLMLFPFLSFKTNYNGFSSYKGLDGKAFLAERFPTEATMIGYLEKNADGKNMIEEVGDSYTETDFISAFSGTPTIVGWRVHEWLWRGGFEEVGKREEEVRRFYEAKSRTEAKEIAGKYKVGWVVVTNRERQKYKINERIIEGLGRVVLKTTDGYLLKLD